jgi:hypothetical protein
LFPDVYPEDQKAYLKGQFKSGRNNEIKDAKTEQHWVPPLSQVLTTQHGNWNIVLGRKKWRSQGGYKPCPWWAEPVRSGCTLYRTVETE